MVCAYCADDFPILNKAAIDISLLHVSLAPLAKDVRIKQECLNLQFKIEKKSHPIHPESNPVVHSISNLFLNQNAYD